MLNELPWYIQESNNLPHPTSNMSIEQIKTLVRIDELLAKYGMDEPWYQAYGKEWVTIRCPFHDDRHPSASLSMSKQRFRCHQCSTAGDIVDIVQQREGLDVKGAIEWIKSMFNL